MSEDKVITVADLSNARACPKETGLFKELFGEGGPLTYEKAMGSALKFDWPFAARHLLTERQQHYFRAIIAADFRQIARGTDQNQDKRRRSMCKAFYLAWNSPEV